MTRDYWNKEYSKRNNLPSSKASWEHPSRAFRRFLELFPDCKKSTLLDIGCGNGRNSIWSVIEGGFQKAIGIDHSDVAIKTAKIMAKENKLEKIISFYAQPLSESFPISNESIDVTLDMMVMHALTKDDRENVAREVIRTLKPGGYLIIDTISAALEFNNERTAYADLLDRQPAEEPGSYYYMVDEDRVIEKGFILDEIKSLYPTLTIEFEELKDSFTPAFGDVYHRIYHFIVLKK